MIAVSWNSGSSVSLVHLHPILVPCAVSNNGHVDYVHLITLFMQGLITSDQQTQVFSSLLFTSITYVIHIIDWHVSICSLHSVSFKFISSSVSTFQQNTQVTWNSPQSSSNGFIHWSHWGGSNRWLPGGKLRNGQVKERVDPTVPLNAKNNGEPPITCRILNYLSTWNGLKF